MPRVLTPGAGTLWAKNTVTKTGAGKRTLGGATGINLDGTVDVQAGALEIEDAFSPSDVVSPCSKVIVGSMPLGCDCPSVKLFFNLTCLPKTVPVAIGVTA